MSFLRFKVPSRIDFDFFSIVICFVLLLIHVPLHAADSEGAYAQTLIEQAKEKKTGANKEVASSFAL